MASTTPCRPLARPIVAIRIEITGWPESGRRMARSISAAAAATAASVTMKESHIGIFHITLAV